MTAAASIPWVALENAFFSWIVGASGVPAKRVVWDHQRAPRPDSNSTPFITMMITELTPFGYDWIDVEDNPDPSPGQEIIKFQRGQRVGTLTVEIFGSKNTLPDGSVAGAIGNTIAADIMGSKLFYLSAFNAIGVGILGFGPSRGTTLKVPIALDPRVIMTITFSVGSEMQMPEHVHRVREHHVARRDMDPEHDLPARSVRRERGRGVRVHDRRRQRVERRPTGTGTGIVDGTAVWQYIGNGPGSSIWVPYDPTP